MEQGSESLPRILGQVPIPVTYASYGTKSVFAKTIIENLKYGSALMVEMESEENAEKIRHIIHNMGYLKWGEKGNMRTKVDGNILYVWLVRQPVVLFAMKERDVETVCN